MSPQFAHGPQPAVKQQPTAHDSTMYDIVQLIKLLQVATTYSYTPTLYYTDCYTIVYHSILSSIVHTTLLIACIISCNKLQIKPRTTAFFDLLAQSLAQSLAQYSC